MNHFYNTGSSYGPVSKFLHWLIAICVILMLACSYFIGDIPNKLLRGTVFNAHKLLGLSILVLMLLRLVWALINKKPSIPNTKLWERVAERLVHYLFYLGLILMPVAGWVGSVAGGRPPRWNSYSFGLPLTPNEAVSDFAFSVHNTLAIILIVLVSLHVLAALYHYFVKKDGVLQRMWG